MAEILDDSSWSCVHGVERWRSNCGWQLRRPPGVEPGVAHPLACGSSIGFATHWPLFLRRKQRDCLRIPEGRENDYIDVVLDRSEASREAFLTQHAHRQLDDTEKITVWKLLELQRHSMLMYTSCGWFFDELSGIETVQVIQYAGRAAQLAEELFDKPLQSLFIEKLSQAKANSEHGDGGGIYQNSSGRLLVTCERSARITPSGLFFERYENDTHIYCYKVGRQGRL